MTTPVCGSNLFIGPARLGLFGSSRVRNGVARLASFVERISSAGEPGAGTVRADVWGEVDGQQVHRIGCGIGQMREATGLSLSIGTLMLAQGELTAHGGGVYAPEACLDPISSSPL